MQRTEIDERLLSDAVRISQIIVGALVAGVVMYIFMTVFVLDKPHEPPAGTLFISYVAAAAFVGAVFLWLVVPKQMVNGQVARLAAAGVVEKPKPSAASAVLDQDSAKLLPLFQTKTIIANALLEGPAFFATVAYSMERQPWALGIALTAVVLMLTTFPTRSRVRDWLQTQQDRIDGIRQFGGPSR